MINLEKGEKLKNEKNREVFQSGEYDENDLVLVNEIGDEIPKYQYPAFYIKNGYHFQNKGEDEEQVENI
jgi:hypothetical protein